MLHSNNARCHAPEGLFTVNKLKSGKRARPDGKYNKEVIKYLRKKITMKSSEQPLIKTGRTEELSCGNTGFLRRVMSVRICLE